MVDAGARSWLPPGKTAAVCFSVDDVHPATSQDPFEAGGDLQEGALGRVTELQRRHKDLKLTLCATPDWRLKSLVPGRLSWRRVPWLRDRVHWVDRHPPHHFRMDRYPRLVRFLNGLERCELVLHGLHHCAPGRQFAVEFQHQSVDECIDAIERGMAIFEAANLRFVLGYVPPSWNAPRNLIEALRRLNFRFLCSARDLTTAISPEALTAHNGLTGVSLLYPQRVAGTSLIHMTCNFQATSAIDRAMSILEQGGLLHIKAHIFKWGGGHTMLDGLDELYVNYLDAVLRAATDRFGGALWWPHLSEVAGRVRAES
jgi:hypothetical protein